MVSGTPLKKSHHSEAVEHLNFANQFSHHLIISKAFTMSANRVSPSVSPTTRVVRIYRGRLQPQRTKHSFRARCSKAVYCLRYNCGKAQAKALVSQYRISWIWLCYIDLLNDFLKRERLSMRYWICHKAKATR